MRLIFAQLLSPSRSLSLPPSLPPPSVSWRFANERAPTVRVTLPLETEEIKPPEITITAGYASLARLNAITSARSPLRRFFLDTHRDNPKKAALG